MVAFAEEEEPVIYRNKLWVQKLELLVYHSDLPLHMGRREIIRGAVSYYREVPGNSRCPRGVRGWLDPNLAEKTF